MTMWLDGREIATAGPASGSFIVSIVNGQAECVGS